MVWDDIKVLGNTLTADEYNALVIAIKTRNPSNIILTSSNYTTSSNVRIINVLASATITLFSASGHIGYEFIIDNAYTNVITVNPTSGELIEGQVNQIIPNNSAMNVYSNGIGWRII